MDFYKVLGMEIKPLSFDAKQMVSLLASPSSSLLVEETLESVTKELSLKEYMRILGLKDRDHALNKATQALEELLNYKVGYADKKRGSSRFNVLGWWDIPPQANVTFKVKFLKDCVKYLRIGKMKIPQGVMQISGKYPDCFPLWYAMAYHAHINHGKDNEYIISVEALLDNTSLPLDSDVRKKTEKIRLPFERSMGILVEAGFLKWGYIGGTPLSYDDFRRAKIFFDILDKACLPAPGKKQPAEKKPLEKN